MVTLLSLGGSDDLLCLSSDVVEISGNQSEPSYDALVVHQERRATSIMRRRCLILTLSSVGIEHSDVVFKTPLRAFIISSGVIVSTCPRDRGFRKACKPDYGSSPASRVIVPIVGFGCRTASGTSPILPRSPLLVQLMFVISVQS